MVFADLSKQGLNAFLNFVTNNQAPEMLVRV